MPENSALFNALAASLALVAVECADAVQCLSGDLDAFDYAGRFGSVRS